MFTTVTLAFIVVGTLAFWFSAWAAGSGERMGAFHVMTRQTPSSVPPWLDLSHVDGRASSTVPYGEAGFRVAEFTKLAAVTHGHSWPAALVAVVIRPQTRLYQGIGAIDERDSDTDNVPTSTAKPVPDNAESASRHGSCTNSGGFD